MKQNDKILPVLYLLLADELTDIKDHLADSEIYQNPCCVKPGRKLRKAAINEIQNAEWLIERIIFFGGALKVYGLDAMMISKSVSDIIKKENDNSPCTGNHFTDVNESARESDEQDTADLLKRIHKMQDGHNEWFGMPLFT